LSQSGAGESEETVSRVRRGCRGSGALRLRQQQAHGDDSDDHHTNGDPNSDGDAPDAGTNDDGYTDRHGTSPSAAAPSSRSTAASRAAAAVSRVACIPLFPFLARVALVPRLRRSAALITREVTFDVEAYSADAIQRALYKLSDRLSGDVRRSEALYCCTLKVEVRLARSCPRRR
jgi:hypothetical protein